MKKNEICPVDATLAVMGGRWKAIILFHLIYKDVLRFNQLQKSIEGITQRMLTNQLRELEQDGIVNRKVYAQVPPKVEYSLTEYGKTLAPILQAMREWGENHIAKSK